MIRRSDIEKKELLQSQKELLQIKLAQVHQAVNEVQITIDKAAKELGISEQEFDQWKMNETFEYFEKKESQKE